MMDFPKKQKAQKPLYQGNPRNSHRPGNPCEMDDAKLIQLESGIPCTRYLDFSGQMNLLPFCHGRVLFLINLGHPIKEYQPL